MNLQTAFAGLVFILGSSSVSSAAASVCPPTSYPDYHKKYDVKTSANFLSRLLSSLGISGEYETDSTERLPTRDDKIMAVIQFATICRMVMQDSTLTTAQRIEFLKGWMISIATYSRNKGSSSEFGRGRHSMAELVFPTAPGLLRAFHMVTFVGTQVADKSGIRSTILSPPPPPPRGATVLRLFLKDNLNMDAVIELRKLLPNFDIRLGHSDVSHKNSIDTLFVDRDNVSEASVLEVLRALEKEGVNIKSVQQTRFQTREIQVGTIVGRSGGATSFYPVFATMPPLDIAKLASLSGNDFWKTALNGLSFCELSPCRISEDGRPVLPSFLDIYTHRTFMRN